MVDFKIKESISPFAAYVVDDEDLAEKAIIGYDFLQEHGAIIDFQAGITILGSGGEKIEVAIPLCPRGSGPKNVNKLDIKLDIKNFALKLISDVILMPGEKYVIPGIMNQLELKLNQKLKKTIRLTVTKTGTDINLINNTGTVKRLKKNSILGIFQDKNATENNEQQTEEKAQDSDTADQPKPVTINRVEIDSKSKKKVLYDVENKKLQLNPNLTKEENDEAIEKIKAFVDIFATKPSKIKLAKIEPQHLQLTDKQPVRTRNYQLAFKERAELVKQAKMLEDAGVLSRKPSKYESPVFLKKKGENEYRFLVDFRRVNSKIEKRGDKPQKIDDIWPYLRNKKYFTKIDLNSGYFQIPLDEESKEVTGIYIEGVNYVFNSIPQGLSLSPFIFQGVMNNVLYDILRDKCIVYMDDILVYGETFQETLQNTIDVLERLKAKGFLLKTTKCHFFDTEVEILGHKIKDNTLQALEKNIEAVKNLKQPKTLRQVRRILGVLNYHRKLIKNFADLTKPLYDVLRGKDSKDNTKLEPNAWGPLQEEAFERIKKILTTHPILEIYDPEAITFLEVDASKYAIGGVLKQISRRTHKPVTLGYFSEKLPKCKQHLGAFDLELLAITRSSEYFRQYLLDKKFTVFTDHEPLTYQDRMKKPSARLARLVTKLGGFTFELRHIAGVKNLVADLLSRHPTRACTFKNGKFEMNKVGKDINVLTRAQRRALEGEELSKNDAEYETQTNKTTPPTGNKQNENKQEKTESNIPSASANETNSTENAETGTQEKETKPENNLTLQNRLRLANELKTR